MDKHGSAVILYSDPCPIRVSKSGDHPWAILMHQVLRCSPSSPPPLPCPKPRPASKSNWSSKPAIEAPTALCVAPNGDVYFAEDPMDMSGPPTKNLDHIWLLKGGDPQKKILFADKMWAVMGLEIVGDKLYCRQRPACHRLHARRRRQGQDRKDLFTDLGPPMAGVPSFNDHIPSGIRMGMDGWLYVSIGDKGIPKMTRKETDRGFRPCRRGPRAAHQGRPYISLEGGGVIRFRPDGSHLEVFASGTRNHLDVPMDEHDRIFVRDNTDDGRGWWTRLMYLPPGGFMGYPWAYTRRPKETLPMIHDFGGGAPCGGYVYCDDGLPETYRGRIFHCEWGQGKVWAVKVAPDGAGFKYVDQIAFMDPAGRREGFSPVLASGRRPTAAASTSPIGASAAGCKSKKAGRICKVTYIKDDVKPAPRGKDTDSIEQLIVADWDIRRIRNGCGRSGRCIPRERRRETACASLRDGTAASTWLASTQFGHYSGSIRTRALRF